MVYSNEDITMQWASIQSGMEEVQCSLIKVGLNAEVAVCTSWCKWCKEPIIKRMSHIRPHV